MSEIIREALEAAEDRLQWVDDWRNGKRQHLCAVDAALDLVRAALSELPQPADAVGSSQAPEDGNV